MKEQNERAGLVGAVRQKAIGFPDLANMERHGKREDASGQQRRIRDTEPLVYGSLDLADARRAHMQGVKQSGRSACIHSLVQFPTGLLDGANEDHQRAMLGHAVEFLNSYHGGDAVFAARLDRDEKGRHTADVFLLPRYDFYYKDGRTAKKASVSKFSKAHAKERFGRDDRRSQGSALQDAFFEHLRDEMQLDGVLPPERKMLTTKDRLEPEVLGLRKDRKKLAENARKLAQADRVARKRNLEKAAENTAEAKRLAEERAKAAQALEAAQTLAERQGDGSRVEKLKGLQERLKRSHHRSVPASKPRIAASANNVARGVDAALKTMMEGDER